MKKYSKVEVRKVFESISGDQVEYKAKKVSAAPLSTLCFKLGKTVMAGLGAAADYKALGQGWTSLGESLYENFTDEQFENIRDTLMGEVYFKDSKGDWVKCDEDYWDECADFLDIMFWLIEENIINFIKNSGMFQRMIKQLQEQTGVNVTEGIESLLKKLKLSISE